MICPHCREPMSYFDHGVCSHCRRYCGCSFNPTSRNDYCTFHYVAGSGVSASRLLLAAVDLLRDNSDAARYTRAHLNRLKQHEVLTELDRLVNGTR